jgi:hypothetical protein
MVALLEFGAQPADKPPPLFGNGAIKVVVEAAED